MIEKRNKNMMKSMTGFGRAEVVDADRKFTVEMKSVNHRYLDFNIKMPKRLSFFESAVRSVLKEYMQRGKVDIFISYEDFTCSQVVLQYNRDMAAQYMKYFKEMQEEFELRNDITTSQLGRCPEVFTMEESTADEKELWSLLEKALREAGEQMVESRQAEGARLQKDLEDKLDAMNGKVDQVEERAPEIVTAYRKRLEDKLQEVLADTTLDENRIAAEVILFADKVCTDEETVRLKSHIVHMKNVFQEETGVGRKLDFIAQEMNRTLAKPQRAQSFFLSCSPPKAAEIAPM